MLKGYKTYLAILLTALVVGLYSTGVISQGIEEWLVGILSAIGLWARSQANK